jgi:hypothetical protein
LHGEINDDVYVGLKGCEGKIVRSRVDRRSTTRLFEGHDAGGESAPTEEKLSGGDESVRDMKAPGGVGCPLHP